MKTAAQFMEIAASALAAPVGALAIDALGLPYARDALHDAARAAARAAHHHGRALDAAARDERLRKALRDAISAVESIQREANLSPAALAGHSYIETCRAQLKAMPPPPKGRPKGSPGRVVHAVAAEATAKVFARTTGRVIPRSGKVADGHPLQALLRAIGADLFGSGAALSVSLLRTSQEMPARAGIPVSRPCPK